MYPSQYLNYNGYGEDFNSKLKECLRAFIIDIKLENPEGKKMVTVNSENCKRETRIGDQVIASYEVICIGDFNFDAEYRLIKGEEKEIFMFTLTYTFI